MANPQDSVHDIVMRPHWPEGLEFGKQYRFVCDDACPSEECRELTVTVSDDGDVWLGMVETNDIHTTSPYHNPLPTVRCRTGAGGGCHRRTRQALLWLADAIRRDQAELKAE